MPLAIPDIHILQFPFISSHVSFAHITLHLLLTSPCFSLNHPTVSFTLSVFSICVSVCLNVCLPSCLSVCLPTFLSVSLTVCLSSYLSTCLSGCLSVNLSVCLSVIRFHFPSPAPSLLFQSHAIPVSPPDSPSRLHPSPRLL